VFYDQVVGGSMKKSIHQKIWMSLWLLVLVGQACVQTDGSPGSDAELDATPTHSQPVSINTPAPPATQQKATQEEADMRGPDSVTWIDILPIEQGDDQVLLWAGAAVASSSAGEHGYHARQARGKPNTLACGRFVTAWQPSADASEAWIELYFQPSILPDQLQIMQSYLREQISKVEVVTQAAQTLTIFDREKDEIYQPIECPASRGFWLSEVEKPISSVRISLVRDIDEDWTQIDAVGVVGWIDEGPTEPMETVVWSEEEEEDFYAPRYYTQKNQVNALTFVGDQLFAATEGGVVSWDTETLYPTTYTAAQGLPANATRAITTCEGDEPLIVAGGVNGIATYSLAWQADFIPIEHPGDENLGSITALACDAERGQIWVGYQGHLGRYDMQTESWVEFGEQDGLPFDVVRQIKVIKGEVWLATAYGVAVVSGGNRLIAYTPENSAIPSNYVHAITADRNGKLWMASSNGLIEFNGQTWTLWESLDIAGGPLVNMIVGVAADPSGNLWLVDTFGVLCQFDPVAKKCLQIIEPPEILNSMTAFIVDPQGRLALGDIKAGTWFVLDGEWFPLRTRDVILDNVIHAIAYAPDGNLWLASRAGLQYFTANQPASPWQEMPLPEGAQPHSLFVGSDGLWIGHTHGARFLPYLDDDPVDLTLGDLDAFIDRTVSAMTVDQDGLVYLGASGLSIWDGSDYTYEDLLSDEQRSKSVYPPRVNALFADGDVVWVGASNGLFKFQQGRLTASWSEILQNLTQSTASVGIISPAPDGNGMLIAVGSSLYRYQSGNFEWLLTLDSEIRSLFALPYALMLATANSGYYTLPWDGFGIYWDSVSGGSGFARRFGYQSFVMSDAHTLWIASAEGGLQRMQALFGQ
jgi:streptogramin lyase